MGHIERWAAEHEPIRERGWTGGNVLSFCYAVPGGANEIAAVLNQHAGAVEALKLIACARAQSGQHAIDVGLARNALEAMGVDPSLWRGQ